MLAGDCTGNRAGSGSGIDCPQQAVPATVDIHPLQNATCGVGVDHPVFAGTRPRSAGLDGSELVLSLTHRSAAVVPGFRYRASSETMTATPSSNQTGMTPLANFRQPICRCSSTRENSCARIAEFWPRGETRVMIAKGVVVVVARAPRPPMRRSHSSVEHPTGHVPIDNQSWRCVLHSIACGTNCGGDGRIAISDETGGDHPGHDDSDDDACDPAAEGGFQGLTSCWMTTSANPVAPSIAASRSSVRTINSRPCSSIGY